MAKYNVEYKVVRTSTDTDAMGSKTERLETIHVKGVIDSPSLIAQKLQEATADGGGLEFLTIRRSNERTVVQPSKPVASKPVVK